MDSCIFCKIIAKEIPSTPVYEDDTVIVIPDIHPAAPTHLLVIPKTHYSEFLDLPDDILQKIFQTAKKIIIEKKVSAYRLVNNGKDAAMVPHFHLHVLGTIAKTRQL